MVFAMGSMSCDMVYMVLSVVSMLYPTGPPVISYTFYGMSYGSTNYIICVQWYCLWLFSQPYGFYGVSYGFMSFTMVFMAFHFGSKVVPYGSYGISNCLYAISHCFSYGFYDVSHDQSRSI